MESTKMYLKNNAGPAILAAAIILAVIIGGIFYVSKSSGSKTLTVTGSAKISVSADTVIWRTAISRNAAAGDVKTGYAQLANDLKTVQAFLSKSGISSDSIIISPVSVSQNYNQNGGEPTSYMLRQSIEIDSMDVSKVTNLAKHIDEVVAQGVLYQTDSLEYYYSKLTDARVSLLTDATKDARARADAMAKSGGQHVGKLQSASSGVVQVLSKGAIDNGEYGQYDTSKIDKDISVTVRATFRLN